MAKFLKRGNIFGMGNAKHKTKRLRGKMCGLTRWLSRLALWVLINLMGGNCLKKVKGATIPQVGGEGLQMTGIQGVQKKRCHF